jgi:lysophospholipase L1-like esterase
LKKYIKQLILFGIVVMVAGLIFRSATDEQEKSQIYEIVFLGDSVIGNYAEPFGVTTVMEERLGKTVFNGALGGTAMSVGRANQWESVPGRQWSMVRLAQAIYCDDWTSQLAAVSYSEYYIDQIGQILDYFYKRLETLSRIDFGKVDILLIEHGTNDYNAGHLLESEENAFDISTYGGALRTTITLLQKKYPDMRIILVSPTYCEFIAMENAKCTETDFGGGVLDAYVELQKNIAMEYDVEWIDLYHTSGIWSDTIDIYTYDKLHLTQEGKLLIGDKISDYLEQNPEKPK